jgi:thioredoxin 1
MITDDNFDDAVLRSTRPTVVMFWQPACAFCKMLLPVVAAVAQAMPFVNFVVMNAEKNARTRERFSLDAFPAILVFKNGEVVDRRLGTASIGSLTSWIKEKA